MSYDVSCYMKSGPGENDHIKTESHNYTSSMTRAWDEAGCPLRDAHGQPVAEWLPKIRAAIADIEARPDYYKQYEPANGWGHVDTMLAFLKRVESDWAQHPFATVSISR